MAYRSKKRKPQPPKGWKYLYGGKIRYPSAALPIEPVSDVEEEEELEDWDDEDEW